MRASIGHLAAVLAAAATSGCLLPPEEEVPPGGEGEIPTGAECEGATQEAAQTCEGLACIGLLANTQGKAGICTELCSGECQHGGTCFGPFPDSRNYCLLPCTTDAECIDGFVCTDIGNGTRACWVNATA